MQLLKSQNEGIDATKMLRSVNVRGFVAKHGN